MTDRELLKLAAQAVGMPPAPKGQEIPAHLPACFVFNGSPWNPLENDGDALRLAVKLGIRIRPMLGFGEDCVLCAADYENSWAQEEFAADPYAATRRAIVRAAAAIAQSRAATCSGVSL